MGKRLLWKLDEIVCKHLVAFAANIYPEKRQGFRERACLVPRLLSHLHGSVDLE